MNKLDLDIDKSTLLNMYKKMFRIRKFEEKVYNLFLQSILPGTIHQYIGQEAVAVGVCENLNNNDFITSTHRPHGHAIAKGVEIKKFMAELFAKAEGCCGARGGSMHIGDPDVGMIPAIAIVGGGLTVAPGLALAFKMMKTKQVAVAFFGEGASNEGAFHEGLNFASVQKLPVLFICENNLYAVSTPWRQTTPVENIADRAVSYSIPAEIVDGMDVVAVYGAAKKAIERARGGNGPSLIEAKTYRFCGHGRFDPAHYRPKEELEAWKNLDPIPSFATRLIKSDLVSKQGLTKLEDEIIQEIEEAVEYAKNLPDPRGQDGLLYVYA